MADKILVSTEALETGIQEFRGSKTEVNEALSSLKNVVDSMESVWKGDAANSFFSAYEQMHTAVSRLEIILDDAANSLETFANVGTETEDSLKSVGTQLDVMSQSL